MNEVPLMSRFSYLLLIPVGLVLIGSALAQNPPVKSSLENRGNTGLNHAESSKPKEKLNKVDSGFVRDVTNTGRSVNEKARLALTQGIDPQIKDFAKRVMDHHGEESRKLVLLAADGGFSEFMSVTGDYFSARTQVDARTGEKRNAASDDLSRFQGAEFDKQFVKQITADLQSRVSKFEAEQKNAANPKLKEFADTTLPSLQDLLAQAKSLTK